MRPAAGVPVHPEPGGERRVWAAGGFPSRRTETSGGHEPGVARVFIKCAS